VKWEDEHTLSRASDQPQRHSAILVAGLVVGILIVLTAFFSAMVFIDIDLIRHHATADVLFPAFVVEVAIVRLTIFLL
jgi:hypothetical protein